MRPDGPGRSEVIPSPPTTITVTSDAPAWQEYLRTHLAASVYHDPAWGKVMAEAYRNRPFYLTARREERIAGLLQLVWQKSALFGSHLCSMPYFDAAGVLADDDETRRLLLGDVRRLMAACRVRWVEIRQETPLRESLPTRTDKVAMWRWLPPNPDALWKGLRTEVRTKVRKAQRSGLVVERGGEELLADYWKTYARAMRELGSPAHGERFFRLILEGFRESAVIFVVRTQGEAAAASFTLRDRLGLHVPWSASDPRLRRLGANRLLFWSMLSYAAETGAPRFDFGRSTRQSTTYDFKREWGAEEVPLHWHYLLAAGRGIPELRPDSARYRKMVLCWRKLPLAVANAIGARIIGKLS